MIAGKHAMRPRELSCLRMRRLTRPGAMALLVFCVGLLGCAAPRIESSPEGTAKFERLEQRLEDWRVRWRIPGMSAAVAREGTILWARGFGQANLADRTMATPDTVYHLASLTKPFAATVLLQLVQERRLNLDAPVSDYGVELKSQGVIRVRHLLSHTSEGIPGETYRYNGTRFGALDKVLTGVTGRSFATELSQR